MWVRLLRLGERDCAQSTLETASPAAIDVPVKGGRREAARVAPKRLLLTFLNGVFFVIKEFCLKTRGRQL